MLPAWWRLYPSRVVTFWLVELRKIRHDRSELYLRAVQPVLWLLIFGETFSHLHAIPTPKGIGYLAYLSPGIMAQSALFIAIFFGIQIIWERDSGILTKLMATPTPRLALISGKAFAAGVRSLAQVVVILVLSVLLQVRFDWNPLNLLGVAAVRGAGSRLLLLSLHDHRRDRAPPGAPDGRRSGDHHAPLLRLQRALPGAGHAGLAPGAERGQSR